MSLASEVAQQCGNASKTPNNGYYNCSCPNANGHKQGDKSASCGFKDGEKEGWIFPKCHGCGDNEAIYSALESKGIYRRPDKKEKVVGIDKAKKGKGKLPEATYDYTDELGDILFQVRRWRMADGGKFFSQHKWNGESYEDKLLDARRVLWRLPKVVETAQSAGIVFLCEGEKDVITMESLGLVATTNPMGGDKWDEGYTQSLIGVSCLYFLPDNDEKGEKHVTRVAPQLAKAGIPVVVVRLPGLPDKGDVTDWIEAGHNLSELLEICGNSPEFEVPLDFTPPPKQEDDREGLHVVDGAEEMPGTEFLQPSFKRAIETLDLGDYPDGDISNGMRMVKSFGDEIRYAIEGVWLGYGTGIWFPDCKEHTHIDSLAKKVIAGIREEARKIAHLSSSLSKRLYIWAKKCNTEGGKVASMVKMARSEEKIKCSLVDFDADPYILNVKNGSLDLRTGVLRPHDRNELHTKQIPVNYNPRANYDQWEETVMTVCNNDWDLMMFLKRALGYSLTGDVREQKAFFLFGPGGNGKSLILNRILKVMAPARAGHDGSAYAVTVRARMFMQNVTESQMDNPGQLKGARAALVGEIAKRDSLNESFLKDVTGDDEIKGRYLFSEPFSFRPQCKLWFRGNFLPSVNDATESIWRRILIIPFTTVFSNPDKDLAKKLDRNLEGILRWLVEGCIEWQEHGLCPPDVVTKATEKYRADMDRIGTFLDDCCEFAVWQQVNATTLYKSYKKWCEDNGMKPESIQKFGRDLQDRPEYLNKNIKHEKARNGWRYVGLGLISDTLPSSND